jgi:hypothetical protein
MKPRIEESGCWSEMGVQEVTTFTYETKNVGYSTGSKQGIHGITCIGSARRYDL